LAAIEPDRFGLRNFVRQTAKASCMPGGHWRQGRKEAEGLAQSMPRATPKWRQERKVRKRIFFFQTFASLRPFGVARGMLCGRYYEFFFASFAYFAVNTPIPNLFTM
jgi:hypothetical protein